MGQGVLGTDNDTAVGQRFMDELVNKTGINLTSPSLLNESCAANWTEHCSSVLEDAIAAQVDSTPKEKALTVVTGTITLKFSNCLNATSDPNATNATSHTNATNTRRLNA